jgi:hypothetical protein
MDRCGAIQALRAGLAASAGARDWERLDAAATALAPRLSQLAAAGAWSAAERRALAALRSAHEHAAAECSGAVLALAQRLEEMRTNKEGWIAYALENQTASEGQP